jgi:NADPH:quinone reductase-like Zn-dependent oxidoreductase
MMKRQGDDVFYSGIPIRYGSNTEFALGDAQSVAQKSQSSDFVEAAAMPLTYVTAYDALVERMEIIKREQAALLTIDGAGVLSSRLFFFAKLLMTPFHFL